MQQLMELLHSPFMGHAVWMWLAFATVVMALLAFDLGVLHARDREIGVRGSLALSAGYVTVAVLFGAWLWSELGEQRGIEYFTGFVIEKSLSIDNVFVIAVALVAGGVIVSLWKTRGARSALGHA